MTPDVRDCIRDAVTIAKDEQIETVAALTKRLQQRDWASGTIKEALDHWRSTL